MDDVTARITVAVEAGDSLRQLSEVENGVKAVTAARNEDFHVAKQTASASADQTAKEKQSDEEIVRLLWEKAKAARAHNEELMKAGQYSQYSGLASGTDSVKSLNQELAGQLTRLSEEDLAAQKVLERRKIAEKEVNDLLQTRDKMTRDQLVSDQNAARVEITDYKAKLAALREYNAELELTAAAKARAAAVIRGDSPSKILALNEDYDEKYGEYIKAQEASATAALRAADSIQQYNAQLTSVPEKTVSVTKSVASFAQSMIILRPVISAMGIKITSLRTIISAFTKGFGAQGLIFGGVTMFFSFVSNKIEAMKQQMGAAIESLTKRLQDESSRADKNVGRIEKQQTVLDRLDLLQQKNGNLTPSELAEQKKIFSELMSELGEPDTKMRTDPVTGKIQDWDAIYAELKNNALTKVVTQHQGRVETLKKELAEANKIVDRFAKLNGTNAVTSIITFPALKAAQEARDLKQAALEQEIEKLMTAKKEQANFDPSEFVNNRRADRVVAAQEEFENLRIQELRIKGMDREAKLAEVTAKWEAKRAQYGIEVEDLIGEEMKLYDIAKAKQKEEQEKQKSKQIQEERNSTLFNLKSYKNRFQETAQTSFLSNNLEGIRMQSRRLLENGGQITAENPERKTAENSSRQVALLKELNGSVKRLILLSGNADHNLSFETV